MTITNTSSKEIKNGNGVATDFSFAFVVNKTADLQVVHTDASDVETVLSEGVGTSNYVMNVSSYPGAGSITYPASGAGILPVGETLTIARLVDLTQDTDLINQGAWNPSTVEGTFDYSRMIDIQQQEEINRSLKAPISTPDGVDFTVPAPSANKVVGVWNGTGDAIVTGPTVTEISNAEGYADAAASSADSSNASAEAAAISAAEAAVSAISIYAKAPCTVATTANITLSGTQTVDGVTPTNDDRILVLFQTDQTENGIYLYNGSGTWGRSTDFSSSGLLTRGLFVSVVGGDTMPGVYVLDTEDPDPGINNILFSRHVDTVYCGNTFANVGGFAEYTLTPIGLSPIPLYDGMRLRFTPVTTSDGGASRASFNGSSMKLIMSSDKYTLTKYSDVQSNKPVTIEYDATLDIFFVTGVTAVLTQSFPHATGKLQASGATSISFTQEDGRGALVWNPTTSAFRPILCPVITNSNLFGAANYVEGVASQALANNQLYHVYLWDRVGAGDGDVVLDFWRSYTGVGSEGWSPIVNEIGIYVKSISGGVGVDNTRTYLGMIWTGAGNIATSLSGANINVSVQSHFKVWRFPFVSNISNVSGFTSTTAVAQSIPSCLFVTTGITDTGYFKAHSSHFNSSAGQVGELAIQITGTTFLGAPFIQTSPVAKATTPSVNGYVNLSASIGTAVPMGVYTVVPTLRVNGGTGQFETYMTGYIAE